MCAVLLKTLAEFLQLLNVPYLDSKVIEAQYVAFNRFRVFWSIEQGKVMMDFPTSEENS